MRLKVIPVLLVVTLLGACNFGGPGYTTQKLPSGKVIKVKAIGKMYTSGEGTSMFLKYQTDLDIDDTEALRAEVEEVWQVFRINVEREGLDKALIMAHSKPKGFIITFNKSKGFSVKKGEDGVWVIE